MTLSVVSQKAFRIAALMGFSGLLMVGCQKPSEPAPQTETKPSSETTAATDTADTQKQTIVIGTTEGDFADMVRNQVKAELEAQGYKVELKTFTDYVMPNQALAAGDLDINIFQHKPYLDTFKAEHNLDLVEVFQVPTAPLGIYSQKPSLMKLIMA